MQIDKYTLYGTRLLVFLEADPQSNHYHQVRLTPDQFKRVSDAISRIVGRNGSDEDVEIDMSVDTYLLPDLQEVYPTT
jgi:hypothetical protein